MSKSMDKRLAIQRAAAADPTQASAARLTARLEAEAARRNSAYDHYGWGNTPETVDPDVYALLAHVETLQQQVASVESSMQALAATASQYRQERDRAQQEQAPLSERLVNRTSEMLVAEQQRDAALAALESTRDALASVPMRTPDMWQALEVADAALKAVR